MKKPEKADLIIRFWLFIWIAAANVIAILFVSARGIPTWPIWFASIFFFLQGMTKNVAISTLGGGVVGLLAALALEVIGIGVLGPSTGHWGLIILLVVILAIIIIGGAWLHSALNNAAFGYLTIASIFLGQLSQGGLSNLNSFLTMLLTFLIGGGIVVAGCMIVLSVVIKSLTPKA